MNRIEEFKFEQGYRVWLKFADGFEGSVDLGRFWRAGLALELLEEAKFRTLAVESGGGLAWCNGYDICPNYLRALMEAVIKTCQVC